MSWVNAWVERRVLWLATERFGCYPLGLLVEEISCCLFLSQQCAANANIGGQKFGWFNYLEYCCWMRVEIRLEQRS